jgi:hypothetical protein
MPWSVDTEPANLIYIDLFPAQVSIGSVNEPPLDDQELKVIVTDNYFYVFHDTPPGPETMIKEPLVEFDGNSKEGYTVTTTLGHTYYFRRAENCGCGSRLRSVRPFDGVPMPPRNIRK